MTLVPFIVQPDKSDVLKRSLIVRLITLFFFADNGSSKDDEGHFSFSVFIIMLFSC